MQCRQCGFSYDLTRDEVADASTAGLEAVGTALRAVPVAARSRRPSPAVWSVNAYTSHLADAAGVILSRVRTIAEEDRPFLPYHDQDEAAAAADTDAIPADRSLERLRPAVEEFVIYLRSLPAAAWDRTAVHERAGQIRLRDIAHDMPHELHHHAADIGRVGNTTASTT